MGHKPPEKQPQWFAVSPRLARYRERLAAGTVNHAHAHKPAEGTPEYEAYRERMSAMGRMAGRKGIPHGWGGRKHELQRVREAARTEAKEIVSRAIVNNQMDPFIADNDNARVAMEYLVSVVTACDANGVPAESTADRIKASAQILQYTKAKPTTTVHTHAHMTAEDWLVSLTAPA